MVDGYGMHLDVRRQLARDVHGDGDGRITPMWTDLTMWAVLAGQHELAIELWSKAESPLRAALMASQLCQRLAKEPLLRADSKELGVSFIRRDILYTTTYFIHGVSFIRCARTGTRCACNVHMRAHTTCTHMTCTYTRTRT